MGGRTLSKFIYLKILRKYNCVIFPYVQIGEGLKIAHPVGIVIGKCVIGKDFTIFQNCTIGVKNDPSEIGKDLIPHIGNNVTLCSNSLILGNVNVCDHCKIGANSMVIKNCEVPGIYVGNPAKRIGENRSA